MLFGSRTYQDIGPLAKSRTDGHEEVAMCRLNRKDPNCSVEPDTKMTAEGAAW